MRSSSSRYVVSNHDSALLFDNENFNGGWLEIVFATEEAVSCTEVSKPLTGVRSNLCPRNSTFSGKTMESVSWGVPIMPSWNLIYIEQIDKRAILSDIQTSNFFNVLASIAVSSNNIVLIKHYLAACKKIFGDIQRGKRVIQHCLLWHLNLEIGPVAIIMEKIPNFHEQEIEILKPLLLICMKMAQNPADVRKECKFSHQSLNLYVPNAYCERQNHFSNIGLTEEKYTHK